jgi:hypothetical protein
VVSDVLAILHRHVADGPEAAALAVWRAAGASAAAVAEAAAVIADDADRDPRLRVAALLAAALLAQGGAPVPATALVALGDDVLLDAVLEAGASAAITGIAAAAGARLADTDRRYLADRLTAAGATGAHVAALLLASGDAEGAAAATAIAIATALREHGPDSPGLGAALHLATAWAAEHGRPFAEAVAAGLPAATCVRAAAAARAVGAGHHHPLVTALESRAATA